MNESVAMPTGALSEKSVALPTRGSFREVGEQDEAFDILRQYERLEDEGAVV